VCDFDGLMSDTVCITWDSASTCIVVVRSEVPAVLHARANSNIDTELVKLY